MLTTEPDAGLSVVTTDKDIFAGGSPARLIDHTLLKPETTSAEIALLCEEAVEAGFASVCVPPLYVAEAAGRLYGSEVRVGTVVGFPLGYETTAVKVAQADRAVAAGAVEVDMVIAQGPAREGAYRQVTDDVRAVVEAVPDAVVKVILECCQWQDTQKEALAEAVIAAGADYLKTSTGFAAGGATLQDVELLSRIAGARARVKAAGGIRDWPTAKAMIAAGANRIGTSAGMVIVQQWQAEAESLR